MWRRRGRSWKGQQLARCRSPRAGEYNNYQIIPRSLRMSRPLLGGGFSLAFSAIFSLTLANRVLGLAILSRMSPTFLATDFFSSSIRRIRRTRGSRASSSAAFSTAAILDNWSLVDRRCFRLMRWHMAKWVREELAKNVSISTLLYDRALMDKNKNYGEGGMCSEILCAGVRRKKKLKPIDGLQQMHEDAMLVGMTMGARAGDTWLPHDAPFMRCLQTEMAAASGHTGPHVREARKGCPACRRPPGNACLECSGWRYRPMRAAPACSNAACPGYVYQEWTRVPGGRGGRGASLVTFAVPTESFRRQARRDAAEDGYIQHVRRGFARCVY